MAGVVISRGQHVAFASSFRRHSPHSENREVSDISLSMPLGINACGCTTEPKLAPNSEPTLQSQSAQKSTKRVRQRSAFAVGMSPVQREVTRHSPRQISSWSSEHDFAPQQTKALTEIEKEKPVLNALTNTSI